MTLTYDVKSRTQDLKHQLSVPLFSPLADIDNLCNITFVCQNGEEVSWNGLALLGSLSKIFNPLSGEEQKFTILLPDYAAPLLRKILILLSNGVSMVRKFEADEIMQLCEDLGVR